jgi:hypothetical protein
VIRVQATTAYCPFSSFRRPELHGPAVAVLGCGTQKHPPGLPVGRNFIEPAQIVVTSTRMTTIRAGSTA